MLHAQAFALFLLTSAPNIAAAPLPAETNCVLAAVARLERSGEAAPVIADAAIEACNDQFDAQEAIDITKSGLSFDQAEGVQARMREAARLYALRWTVEIRACHRTPGCK